MESGQEFVICHNHVAANKVSNIGSIICLVETMSNFVINPEYLFTVVTHNIHLTTEIGCNRVIAIKIAKCMIDWNNVIHLDKLIEIFDNVFI